MQGPLVALINHVLMALQNAWGGHASFTEMVIPSFFGAVSMSLVAMMAPKKKEKAKPKTKAKGKDKAGDKKRKKDEEEAVADSDDEEQDPAKMTADQKRKLMSNLAGQLKNAKEKMEKHVTGTVVLEEAAVKALQAKIDHCESYQKLKQGDPEKEKLLMEFKTKAKGNLWGNFSHGYHKAEVDTQERAKGYGTKLLKFMITHFFFFWWIGCLSNNTDCFECFLLPKHCKVGRG